MNFQNLPEILKLFVSQSRPKGQWTVCIRSKINEFPAPIFIQFGKPYSTWVFAYLTEQAAVNAQQPPVLRVLWCVLLVKMAVCFTKHSVYFDHQFCLNVVLKKLLTGHAYLIRQWRSFPGMWRQFKDQDTHITHAQKRHSLSYSRCINVARCLSHEHPILFLYVKKSRIDRFITDGTTAFY